MTTEERNERLRLGYEMIFREVVFNMLATAQDEQFAMRWMQNRIESIYCKKVDDDEADAIEAAQSIEERIMAEKWECPGCEWPWHDDSEL